MPRGRFLPPLEMTEQPRQQLESMAKSRSLPHGLVRRAEIVLPGDVVAASAFEADARTKVTSWDEVPDGWLALDIGPAASGRFAEAVRSAAPGVCERPGGRVCPALLGGCAYGRSL